MIDEMKTSMHSVGVESDQQVNIYSFAVCCDRRWPSTQGHRVYTGSGGLDGVRVFHTLYHRQVAPLVERTQPMWKYNGPMDPDHASSEELPDDEVWSHLDQVL